MQDAEDLVVGLVMGDQLEARIDQQEGIVYLDQG